ncbi:hypothetical protein NL676_033483 [Syzygium grande]|nr:hypothetical protein NL676_033483 [Syzygium grande]
MAGAKRPRMKFSGGGERRRRGRKESDLSGQGKEEARSGAVRPTLAPAAPGSAAQSGAGPPAPPWRAAGREWATRGADRLHLAAHARDQLSGELRVQLCVAGSQSELRR